MNVTAKLVSKVENENQASLTFSVDNSQHLNMTVTPEEFATFQVGKSYNVTVTEVQGE